MYLLLLLVLLAGGAWLLRSGLGRQDRARVGAGAALVVATVAFFGLLSFWGEMLWYEALGYAARFWTFLGAQAAAALAGALLGGLVAGAVAWPTGRATARWGAAAAGLAIGALLGTGAWESALLYLNRVETGVSDPILGRDTGFYLFSLPFYARLHGLLLAAVVIGLGAAALATFERDERGELRLRTPGAERPYRPLLIALAVLALVLAAGRLIDAFQLLYSPWGVVAGPGWTDVHVRLPAYLVLAAVLVVLGALPLVPALGERLAAWAGGRLPVREPALIAAGAAWAAIGAVWVIALGLAPAATQALVVEPNEITLERPYIAHNIAFTRRGFHLDKVEERRFPAAEQLTRSTIEDNRHLISEVRLWDWRALDAVYKQFQEIRLYYEFVDVDMDRYTLGERYRQVMASARELDQGNLPARSRTFVNQRFKYTHGYGLTLATVSDFTPEGLPNLLVKDIPPRSAHPALEVERPQIYYGELTEGPVVVNTEEPEFDHPSGETNVYIRYPGTGGVELSSLWRKFLYGWKFDGTPFLLSSYPTRESRVMFHREVRERARRIAPFLAFDEDPYVVLADGRLYWIIDAYTTSSDYPYSQPFSGRERVAYRDGAGTRAYGNLVAGYLEGVNYLRNAVKVVVDAFEGSVDLYVFEPDDPLVQAWDRALPGLLKPREDMPAALRAHVRYPQDLLLAQGLVYAKYHMGDPAVFYNQEDLWVRATEKHYDQVVPVEPYYVMWELPGSDRAEFVLMLPFTPKNRQVLIGWIAGLSDGDNYGRFLAYKFPKEKRVLGPQQVETKIDQDRFLSGQLTLWDQRGSNVIRGNVLAIPIDDTLLYVEPIYLQAETAAYPELRLVVAMHGDTMSYAESFDQALQGLLEGGARDLPAEAAVSLEQLGPAANEAFEAYLEALGEQRFDEAARQLQRLSELLGRLSEGGRPAE